MCKFAYSPSVFPVGLFALIASLPEGAKSEFKDTSSAKSLDCFTYPLFLLLWVIGCHDKHTFSKDWAKLTNPPWQKGDLEDSSGAITSSLRCSTSWNCFCHEMWCSFMYVGAHLLIEWTVSWAELWCYNLMEMKITECHNGYNNNVDVIQIFSAL